MTAMRARPVARPRFSTATRTSRFPAFQLSASPQTGLRTSNPRLINFHFTPQRFAREIDHSPPKLVEHHPRRLVKSDSKLALQK